MLLRTHIVPLYLTKPEILGKRERDGTAREKKTYIARELGHCFPLSLSWFVFIFSLSSMFRHLKVRVRLTSDLTKKMVFIFLAPVLKSSILVLPGIRKQYVTCSNQNDVNTYVVACVLI